MTEPLSHCACVPAFNSVDRVTPEGELASDARLRRWSAGQAVGRRELSLVCRLGAWFGLVLGPVLIAQAADAPARLAETQPLEITQPLDEVMVDGLQRYALRAIEQAASTRNDLWERNYSALDRFADSVQGNREEFARLIGVVDPRVTQLSPGTVLLKQAISSTDSTMAAAGGPSNTSIPTGDASSASFTVRFVQWDVLPGVTGTGLILEPSSELLAKLPAASATGRTYVIVVPDADWSPDQLLGERDAKGCPTPLARDLVARGCTVIIPQIVSRGDTFSGNPEIAATNMSHREYIYRMAFEMGRHVIGYEVQKCLALVDILKGRPLPEPAAPRVAIAGVGEGGLIALYAAAVDPRIDAAFVSGYFQDRAHVWQEPIERNVWKLLTRFSDSDLASLIAPRPLVVEAAGVASYASPRAPAQGKRNVAAPGKIETPELESVTGEYEIAQEHYKQLEKTQQIDLVVSGDGTGPAGSPAAVASFARLLKLPEKPVASVAPTLELPGIDWLQNEGRQIRELVDFTQRLLWRSWRVRDQYWAQADRSSLDAWTNSTQKYREQMWKDFIGKLPTPAQQPVVRSRKVLNTDTYTGYEVLLEIEPDVIAGGILLLPADLRPEERRPVVVCQHGLEGVPMDTIDGPGSSGYPAYKSFAAELVRRGFIVYAPQNPYRGRDRFRVIQRMSNPLGRSLFSYILLQHQKTLQWLAKLPGVDPERIAFYGLSYGGKTAVRVPPLLADQYCLSICSADFNEWVVKNTTIEHPTTYVFTMEYEIFEWNMGHIANYAELSNLMTPRPFMVERGHDDGVAPDEWVAWEYAKVRRHYDKLGIGDRTEIEFFNGPHTINGQGTYAFLHRHLHWPEPAAQAVPKAAAR